MSLDHFMRIKLKIVLLILSLIVSFVRPVMAMETDEEKGTVARKITLNDQPDEILQKILDLVIASNSEEASDMMQALRRVSRRFNAHLTDLVFLNRHFKEISDSYLEKWGQLSEEDCVKKTFAIVYASKRLAGLECKGELEKAKEGYKKALFHPSSPLQGSRSLAYRVGLLRGTHTFLFTNDETDRGLEEKAMSAADSLLCDHVEDEHKGQPLDVRKDEVIDELYYAFRDYSSFQMRVEHVKRYIKRLKTQGSSDIPAYFTGVIALSERLASPEIRVKLLKEASLGGDVIAQYELSRYYMEKNFDKALEWLNKSAEGNYPEALYNLGIYHAIGFNGRMRDMRKATELLAQAAEYGMAEAGLVLICDFGNSYPVSQQIDLTQYLPASDTWNDYAIEYFEHAKKQYKHGLHYAARQNWSQATMLFGEAAFLGHQEAQRQLGLCYEIGLGVPLVKALSIGWIQEAALWEQRGLQQPAVWGQRVLN